MAVEASTRVVTFESRPDDDLHGVVLAAARAVASDEFDAGGLLEVAPVGEPGETALRLEASLSDDGLRSAIVRLDVHLSALAERVSPELVREAAAAFGGAEYTNLCVGASAGEAAADAAAPRGEDALDVTVTFPEKWRIVARNHALVRPAWTADERAGAVEALRALGVGFRLRAGCAVVRGHQLRRRLTRRAQADALLAAAARGLATALYTARIPPSSSLRLAVAPGVGGRCRLEVCISHGLIAERATTAEEVLAIQRFAERHFAFRPAARSWRVASRTWTSSDAQAGAPRDLPRRRGQ